MTFKQFEIERIHKKKILNILDYGSKAAQMRSLVKLGLPVPPGFLIPRDLVHKKEFMHFELARLKESGEVLMHS